MKRKKVKLRKVKEVSRLFDIEIDEISLVDKPAIKEEFYITKTADGRKIKVGKKKKNKKKKSKKSEKMEN